MDYLEIMSSVALTLKKKKKLIVDQFQILSLFVQNVFRASLARILIGRQLPEYNVTLGGNVSARFHK